MNGNFFSHWDTDNATYTSCDRSISSKALLSLLFLHSCFFFIAQSCGSSSPSSLVDDQVGQWQCIDPLWSAILFLDLFSPLHITSTFLFLHPPLSSLFIFLKRNLRNSELFITAHYCTFSFFPSSFHFSSPFYKYIEIMRNLFPPLHITSTFLFLHSLLNFPSSLYK